MNRTQLLALALVAVLVVPGTATASVRGSPDLKASLGDNRVTAGESTTLELTIVNSGNLDQVSLSNPALNEQVTTARGVEVTLGERNAPLTVESDTRLVGGIASGQSVAVGFDISVDDDAEPGTYELPVTVEYTHTNFISERTGATNDHSVRERLTVTVVVEESATFRVEGVETDAQVGDNGSVSLTLTNTGSGTATDAAVTLTSLDGAVTVGGGPSASRYVGSWAAGETRTVTYDVAVAAGESQQAYAAQVVVSHVDANDEVVTSRPFATGITPQAETEFSVSGVASALYVGEQGALRGTVRNDGPTTVTNAVLTLRSGSAHIQLADESVSIGTLESGSEASFEFAPSVSADAAPGVRPFSAVIEYETATGAVKTSDPLRVSGQVQPEREFFRVEPVNATFAPDSNNRLEVVVTNIGEAEQTDIVVSLSPTQPFTSVAPESYIPRLAPGESVTVAFELTVDQDAVASTHAIGLNITSDSESHSAEHTDAYRLPVSIAEENTPVSTNSIIVVALLGVAILGGVGYWWYRRD